MEEDCLTVRNLTLEWWCDHLVFEGKDHVRTRKSGGIDTVEICREVAALKDCLLCGACDSL